MAEDELKAVEKQARETQHDERQARDAAEQHHTPSPNEERDTAIAQAGSIEIGANDREYRAAERCYWQRQLRIGFWLNVITAIAGGVASIGIVVLIATLLENRNEFQASQKAQIVFGDPTEQAFQMVDLDEHTANFVVTIKNDGHSTARDLAVYFKIVSAPPDQTIKYAEVLKPPLPGMFQPGVTVPQGATIHKYYPFIKDAGYTELLAGTRGLRIVGKLVYRDEFGSYCSPIAWIYMLNPSRFEPELVPPRNAVCDPTSSDSEVIHFEHGQVGVHFSLKEPISGNQPKLPILVPSPMPFP